MSWTICVYVRKIVSRDSLFLGRKMVSELIGDILDPSWLPNNTVGISDVSLMFVVCAYHAYNATNEKSHTITKKLLRIFVCVH